MPLCQPYVLERCFSSDIHSPPSTMISPLSSKMLYRYKVGIFAGIVACLTFLIAYVTIPRHSKGPNIRVLYISFSDNDAVQRFLSTPFVFRDGSVQILKTSMDGTVTINRAEWDLSSSFQDFYENNIVLECTASFPVTWMYSGFGDPTVTEKNTRIHGDFNDTSTFTFLSVLNLMPLTEKSTGEYSCVSASNDTGKVEARVHLFVPGETLFLIDYDTSVDTPGGDEIFIPCPVTNASANISLYFKGQPVVKHEEDKESLHLFDPRHGFHLKPRFIEQSDPWGPFYCKDEETNEKSGIILVQPDKGLIVNPIPKSDTVLLSKSGGNNNDLKENFKFTCQAKEEIKLKFLRVVTTPMVHYEYNSSSSFPFSAKVEVNTRNLRNLSRIYCRAVRSNQDLHSWKVVFSSLSMRTELMDFHYDANREEFACCSPSNKRAKLAFVQCASISECRIKSHCLLSPSRKCNPDNVLWVPGRAGCVRHKLFKDERNVNNEESLMTSGLLQCSIDSKNVERIFIASRYDSGGNGTLLNTLSGEIGSPSGLPLNILESPNPPVQLQIKQIFTESLNGVLRKRFLCRGVKFFLASGFLWQAVRANNDIKFHIGRDIIKGAWVQSRLDLEAPTHGGERIKRVNCIAPLWSANGGWVNVKYEIE